MFDRYDIDYWRAHESRVWSKIDKTDTCWIWCAMRNAYNYGKIKGHRGVTCLAHIVVWVLTHGAREQPCVLHTCDNPPCVRPDHLFAGTKAQNNTDRAVKGRSCRGDAHWTRDESRRLRGEKNGRAVLTADQVLDIRRRYQRGATSQQSLADEFGVDQVRISSIILRKSWAHI